MPENDPLLKPVEAADYVRMTPAGLAQLRFRRVGPPYLKPTVRTVLYRKSALDEWLKSSERGGQVA